MIIDTSATVEFNSATGDVTIGSEALWQDVVMPLAEAYGSANSETLEVYEESEDQLLYVDVDLLHNAVDKVLTK